MRFLDPVALAKVGSFPLRVRVVVEGALSGLHRSPHHGSSVEFAEHKEYSPGDELRHLDWKAFGKFDRYYVKRFEQETELTAYLVLDASGSMAYRGAGLSKLEYGAYLAGALAYLLTRQQDRVGLLAFGGEGAAPLAYVPPRSRAQHLHDVLATLERVEREGGRGPTRVAAALDRVAELARRRRALVVLVSDLFDRSPEVEAALRRLRALGHDVSVVQLLDRDELEFPFDGVTMFESLEDERRLLVDPGAARAAYLRELEAFLDGVRRACRERDVEHHLVPTTRPLEQALLDFLQGRGLRRGAAARRGGA